MTDWRTIESAPTDEVVLCGWWFSHPAMGCWWEMAIDVPHDGVTHWRPLEEVEGRLPARPAMVAA